MQKTDYIYMIADNIIVYQIDLESDSGGKIIPEPLLKLEEFLGVNF